MSITAILFDLDNTLIDRDQAVADMLAPLPPDLRQHLWGLDDRGRGSRRRLFAAWPGMNQELWTRQLVGHLPVRHDLQAWLRGLRPNYRLGLVSNGGGPTQRAKLEAAGLLDCFEPDHLWISGEVGWDKPDPRIFWKACAELGVPPHRCLMVGDNLETDGQGARNAGLAFRHQERPL